MEEFEISNIIYKLLLFLLSPADSKNSALHNI